VTRIAGRTFGPTLAVPEFRRLWFADIQSMLGDQLSRVALSILVYDRTKSGLATATVYALTFLPALFGGVLLGGIGDRWPRRRVLVACDVSRAGLLAAMAIPKMPIWLIAALLAIAVLIGSAFKASESALVADILEGELYTSGVGLRTISSQTSQLVGFAAGGAVVAAFGPRTSLLVDAVTFAASASLIQLGVKARPAPPIEGEASDVVSTSRRIALSIRRVFAERTLRALLGLSWLMGCYVVPEGLVAPYSAAHGGGPLSLGLLLAANPAGTAVGAWLLVRSISEDRRRALVGPLAVAAGLPLIACFMGPPIPVTVALLALSGVFGAYQVQVIAEFVRAIPPGLRGQAIGVASSGLLAVQGIGLLLGGVLAEVTSATSAIALAGVAGSAIGLYLAAVRAQGRGERGSTSPATAPY
jgi:predicted MFS family arabinose efflux permease